MNRKRKHGFFTTACAVITAALLTGCEAESSTELPTDTLTETSSAAVSDTLLSEVSTSETTVETTTVTTVSETAFSETEAAQTTVSVTASDTDVSESKASETSVSKTVTVTASSETTFSVSEASAAYVTDSSDNNVESDAVSDNTENTDRISSSVTFSASGNPLYFPADGEESPYTGRKTIDHPYSYYTLSDKYQKIYDEIVSAMLDCESSIDFSYYDEVSFDDIFSIYQLIYNDEYNLFYISPTIEYTQDNLTGYIVKMHLLYDYDTDDIAEMKKEAETETKKILSELSQDMSDYEIVKLFHDYVITSCTYSADAQNPNDIYGCLVNKEGLCQAYSQTFTYLCHRAGIRTLTVLGVADEPHMWNIVEMDGDYYHIDLTWDDPDRERNPDSVRYDYFGLTDERIRELRQVDDYDYEVPAANGTKYYYYSYNNLIATNIDEAKEIIIRETLKAAESGSSTVQFVCIDGSAFNEITSVLFSNTRGNVITVLEEAKKQSARLFNTESVYHNSNERTLTVKIFLDYLD